MLSSSQHASRSSGRNSVKLKASKGEGKGKRWYLRAVVMDLIARQGCIVSS